MSVNRDTLPSDPSGRSRTISSRRGRERTARPDTEHAASARLCGYMVLFAGDSEAALKISNMHRDAIDLLIVDVVMPGLTGPELARRLRARCPNLRVLFISGFLREPTVQRETLPDAGFIEKPFPPEALVGKVQEILHKGSA